MNKKQSIMLAVVGAGLMATSQAHAQANMNYNDGDLLLNFRNSATDAGSDVAIDLGAVSSFVSSVSAAGGTAVLDSGTGYNTSAYTTQFTGSSLISAVSSSGSASTIGFSASAENLSGTATPSTGLNTLWLSRQITSSQEQTGGTPSVQGTSAFQNKTAQAIQNVGFEAESSANGGTGTALSGALNAGVVSDTDPLSYHTLGKSTSSPDVINYGGSVSGTTASPLEATPGATTPVYEALWEAPVAGTGADTYLGYFTFDSDGEVDFTVAAVPEPATYSIFAATGILALALRRQFRSLTT